MAGYHAAFIESVSCAVAVRLRRIHLLQQLPYKFGRKFPDAPVPYVGSFRATGPIPVIERAGRRHVLIAST